MSNDSFLPENYEAPKAGGGNYTKLQDGETRLRILSNPIFGFEYWNTDGKPVRVQQRPNGKPADMRLVDNNGREEKIKEFWAMKVYNYNEQQMQVCQITQSQIKNALAELSRDADWGHPKQYDVKITRSGKGLETKYVVTPVVPKPVSEEVKKAYGATPINLEALFSGDDPFAGGAPAVQPQQAPAAQQQQAAPAQPTYVPGQGVMPPAPPVQQPAPAATGGSQSDDLPF